MFTQLFTEISNLKRKRRNPWLGGIFFFNKDILQLCFELTLVHFRDFRRRTPMQGGVYFSSPQCNLLWLGGSLGLKGETKKTKKSSTKTTCYVISSLQLNFQPLQMLLTLCECMRLCTLLCLISVLWDSLSRWTHRNPLYCAVVLLKVCVGGIHRSLLITDSKRLSAPPPANSNIISIMSCKISIKLICPLLIGSLGLLRSHIQFNEFLQLTELNSRILTL